VSKFRYILGQRNTPGAAQDDGEVFIKEMKGQIEATGVTAQNEREMLKATVKNLLIRQTVEYGEEHS
jgi:hypothetical protein